MSKTYKDKNIKHIDPNDIKTRDHYMVMLINGATKSGVHMDKRKAKNKFRCRDYDPDWD